MVCLSQSFPGVFSCQALREKGLASLDGEYLINPSKTCDSPIKVYCYGMDTESPKEYITLQSGPLNNYAIVYDKRMPLNDKYQCSSKPSNIVYSKAGNTQFRKVLYILHLSLFVRISCYFYCHYF